MTTNELTAVLEGVFRNHAEKSFGTNEATAAIAAVIALAALFVAWLARKDSKRSADAAQRVTELMAHQLELATSELNRQIQKDTIDSQPRITWDYGPAGAQSVTHKLKNYGGVMSNVTVACAPGFQATISPKDVIAPGTEAEVQFICTVQPQPNPFKFFVEFDDKFNKRQKMNFTASRRQSGTWELPEPAKN
jgi:hypothetical protein